MLWVLNILSKCQLPSLGNPKNIESVTILIPPLDPPAPHCERPRFFLQCFVDYCGCLVRGETNLVKYWVFDQNNAKEGQPQLDI